MKTTSFPLILALSMLARALPAAPQSGSDYELTWSTLDAAGGPCVGSTLTLTGTVGQPDAAQAAGGNYSLAGGFWQSFPEAGPQLNIAWSAGSTIVSWPNAAAGFRLEYCTDLTRRNWVRNTTPVITYGDENLVVEAAQGLRFYRLAKP